MVNLHNHLRLSLLNHSRRPPLPQNIVGQPSIFSRARDRSYYTNYNYSTIDLAAEVMGPPQQPRCFHNAATEHQQVEHHAKAVPPPPQDPAAMNKQVQNANQPQMTTAPVQESPQRGRSRISRARAAMLHPPATPELDYQDGAPPYPPTRAQRTIKKEPVDETDDAAQGQQAEVKKEEVDELRTIMEHTVEPYKRRLVKEDTDEELRSSKKHRCSAPSPDPQPDAQPDAAPAPKKPAKKRPAKKRSASKRPLNPLPRWRSPSPPLEGWNPFPRSPRKKTSRRPRSSPPVPQTTTPEELAEFKRRMREGGFECSRELRDAQDSLEGHRCRAPSPGPYPDLQAGPPPPPPNSPALQSPAAGPSPVAAPGNYIPPHNNNPVLPPAQAPPRSNSTEDNYDRKAPYSNYIPENDAKIDMSISSSDEDKPAPGHVQQQHGIPNGPSGLNYRAHNTVNTPFPPSLTEVEILMERNRERIVREGDRVEMEMERLREANRRRIEGEGNAVEREKQRLLETNRQRLETEKAKSLTNAEKQKPMAERNTERVRKKEAEKLKRKQEALKRGLEYQENCKMGRMSKEEQLLKANRDRLEKETAEKQMAERARFRAARERAAGERAVTAAAAAAERA